ncbi:MULTISPECIES: hypothetical protein [unclassified Streptomyces]|uniref:hypothetical protein n=1 Tax=unclassified Streptomyces TaxID=2593676 RepID=UPI00343734B4
MTQRRFWVTPANEDQEQQLLLLSIDGRPRLKLDVSFYCHWDTERAFMAIDQSCVKVYYHGRRSPIPLMRYEYERRWTGYPPGAHLHVHAHRDEIAYLLRLAESGNPAQRLTQDRLPQLSEMHLTVGGHRFRPCFEDVLSMLIREFAVDTVPGWEKVIDRGVQRWRKTQLRTTVRDLPEVAAEKLRELGWSVEPPAGTVPPPRPSTPRLFCP